MTALFPHRECLAPSLHPPAKAVPLPRCRFGDFNAPHAHTGNHHAGVLYVSTGGDSTASIELLVRDPTTWTILQKDGPNHLGLPYNELHEHQMALITSGCVPCRTLGPTCTPHSPPSCTTAGSAHRRSDRERPGCRRPCGGRELGGPSRSRRGWRSSSRPGSSIGSTLTPVRLAYKGFAAVALHTKALPPWPCRCGLAAVALPLWPCRRGPAALALPPWPCIQRLCRRGLAAVALPLWPCRCGLAAVALPHWPCRRGLAYKGFAAVALPLWPCRRGLAAVALPPWPWCCATASYFNPPQLRPPAPSAIHLSRPAGGGRCRPP